MASFLGFSRRQRNLGCGVACPELGTARYPAAHSANGVLRTQHDRSARPARRRVAHPQHPKLELESPV